MVSQECIDMIKGFEGYRKEAYQDKAGVWTIGYGTTRYWHGEKVEKGHKISEELAFVELVKHCNEIEKDIQDLMGKLILSENKMSALISFVYNLGLSKFSSSTLLVRLHTENWQEAANEMQKWIYITDPVTKKKVKSNGLINRRKAESELFLREL